MQPKDYQQIILKALTDGRKHGSVEALAAHIVDRMEVYSDIMGWAGNNVLIQTPVGGNLTSGYSAPTPIQQPNASVAQQSDIGERIVDNRHYDIDEIIAMKGELNRKYQAELPRTIEVPIPGFAEPLRMIRYNIASAPGDMPYLKITYVRIGAQTEQEQVAISVNVLDTSRIPTAEAIQKEVIEGASRMFSAAPRKVQTRMPMLQGGLGDLSNALGAETDNENDPRGWAAIQADRKSFDETAAPLRVVNGELVKPVAEWVRGVGSNS